MRYAVLHCRHCTEHIWVPHEKLGLRGACPLCGHAMNTPAAVPDDALVEAPPIMRDFEDGALHVAAMDAGVVA